MTEHNIKHYRALAARWDGDALMQGGAAVALAGTELIDLLGWVRAYMDSKAQDMDSLAMSARNAVLLCVVAKALEIGHFKAACLCEEAGWPS